MSSSEAPPKEGGCFLLTSFSRRPILRAAEPQINRPLDCIRAKGHLHLSPFPGGSIARVQRPHHHQTAFAGRPGFFFAKDAAREMRHFLRKAVVPQLFEYRIAPSIRAQRLFHRRGWEKDGNKMKTKDGTDSCSYAISSVLIWSFWLRWGELLRRFSVAAIVRLTADLAGRNWAGRNSPANRQHRA